MTPSVQTLIETRVSSKHYDVHQALTDAQLHRLVELATRAPSAFNFQNWKFIAVRSPEAKARLHSVSYRQQQVLDAPVNRRPWRGRGLRRRAGSASRHPAPRAQGGHADADPDRQRGPGVAHQSGAAHRSQQPLGHFHGLGGIGLRQQGHKFLAAPTAKAVS